MIKNFLEDKITENFTHIPTNDQSLAIKKISDFVLSPEPNSLFLLKGYAGTVNFVDWSACTHFD